MKNAVILDAATEFLRKHGMSTRKLSQLQAEMLESKAELNKALGLTAENLYRRVICLEKTEDEVMDQFPLTYAAVVTLADLARRDGKAVDISSVKLSKNEVRVKNQAQKISKLLSKYTEEHPHVVDTCMKELKISSRAQFLPKLGDIIKSGRRVVISTNMLDILTGSDNASFSSCHSFTGCHYNGNIAYCRDKQTLIAYVIGEKADPSQPLVYKDGRSWVWVVGDGITMAKTYGAFLGFERKLAMGALQEYLAAHHGFENKWVEKTDQTFGEQFFTYDTAKDSKSGSKPVYFDNHQLYMARPAHVVWKEHVKLQFASAICLYCGITTNNPDKGECSSCKTAAKCSCCSERVPGDQQKEADGNILCPECYEKLYDACGCCSAAIKKGKGRVVDGQLTCPACIERAYVTCSCCKELKKRDTTAHYPGITGPMCDKCMEGYKRCDVCGDHFVKADVHEQRGTGHGVCNGCLQKEFTPCSICGIYSYTKGDHSKNLCKEHGGEVIELVPCERKPCIKGLPSGWYDVIQIIG